MRAAADWLSIAAVCAADRASARVTLVSPARSRSSMEVAGDAHLVSDALAIARRPRRLLLWPAPPDATAAGSTIPTGQLSPPCPASHRKAYRSVDARRRKTVARRIGPLPRVGPSAPFRNSTASCHDLTTISRDVHVPAPCAAGYLGTLQALGYSLAAPQPSWTLP
ncbi:uncharacterized protein CC84DRAFT_1178605 [Paraphaeosphaeria sporulosa]|uniref:Uncharacterized protein n=1 Tax=Paraphaeosphaeria sporulosa TaxID=1460663 RepID=A0A177C7G6_9PLEO|nr:uncharacterized protein CC84DRAFT_1178605 [Paraphaeosphaeria sporulosa]OAG03071.1 hypothetical protein CC84DRAFT_1178605 [Paraphaeosphaeria sporulosa]